MVIFTSALVGLVLWVILWAIGVKSFDAFMLTIGLVVLAATARTLMPALPGNRSGSDERS